MTTATPTPPQTTLALLFGTTGDHLEALADAIRHQHLLRFIAAILKRSRAVRKAAAEQIIKLSAGLLDLDLGDLLLDGWRKHSDLTGAAERTMAAPETTEILEPATHHITSTHSPAVDLLVNEVEVATLHFELCVELLISELVATVHKGRLTALSGSCEATATLRAEDMQLAERSAHLQLPHLVRPGNGIPLLHRTGTTQ